MKVVDIAVVDGHPLMIEAVSALVGRTPGVKIVDTGTNANDVICIASRSRPRVLITDVDLPGSIFSAIKIVPLLSPETKVLIFTAASGVAPAVRALNAGAMGYVLKFNATADLLNAIVAVDQGQTYITKAFSDQAAIYLKNETLRRRAAEAVTLTMRDEQIIRLLVRDQSNEEISDALRICKTDVEHHVARLTQRMHARNRLEALISACHLKKTANRVKAWTIN
ncbi:response regulator [Tardiphaga sp. 20_F10_N6_6]|uniref:response regulator n=1 Tax=Tardiphaga sp. 20_F10_N6_6 TaxID=3240788 RepID=UPI003F8895D3